MNIIMFLLLISFSVESLSATIIMKGQASPLEYGQEPYYLPKDSIINPDTTNLFITVDGIDKVCFLNKTPSLLFEQVSQINIVIKGIKTEWNCFPYKTTNFPVRP